jgi:hypothetical protein
MLLLIISTFQVFALAPAAYQKTYFWEFEGRRYNLSYSFDAEDYTFYKGQKRDYYDFAVYLTEAPGYPVIDQFARKLKALATSYKLNQVQTVEMVASFVQQLKYRDDGKYEYPRYPIETLIEQGGDCEDTAILLAALLRSMGYKSILLSPTGHMGVGIAVDGKMEGTGLDYQGDTYYYLETTNKGWGIGDYPDHLSEEIKIYDPGYLVGGKALALKAPGVVPSTRNTEVQTVEANTPSESNDYTFQTDYVHDKQLIGADSEVLSTDTMVIDGRQQSIITYADGESVVINEN